MDVFDILGPVMIGPSSSHTAGAVRLGRITRELLGSEPVRADILLHGSFAKTYRGHGTDRAILAGIMGMDTSDPRIRRARELAEERGLTAVFETGEIEGAHANTARITLKDKAGKQVSLQGSSVGGGNILVTRFNGMDVSFTGEKQTLIVLHRDRPGLISAVTEVMAETGANIASFRLSRQQKGGQAVMTIELDGMFTRELNDKISRLPGVYSSVMLRPV